MAKSESLARQVIDRYKQLKSEKDPWSHLYELVYEYVLGRSYNSSSDNPGAFLADQISDSTAPKALHMMASSLIGMLFPNAAKSIRLVPSPNVATAIAQKGHVKKWYETATNRVNEAFDNPKAGFLINLESYFKDIGSVGISAISAIKGEDISVPVVFKAESCRSIVVDENKHGFIDTVFVEEEMTVRKLVLEYGLDNISAKYREAFNNCRYEDKVKVLRGVFPRMAYGKRPAGNAGMPIASIHIEMDTEKILRNSGFHEMPIFASRFYKIVGEKYGRSPAMECLSDIMEANAMRDASIVAVEKQLDPPLAVFQDGAAGGGDFDTSPGAINVYQISGRMGGTNQRFIEPIYTIGELQSTYKRITELAEIIYNAFFIDRLMDLNNETRMTAYETQVRTEFRGQSLNTVFARQIAELFTPLIERVFNICFEWGLLGVAAGSPEEEALIQQGETDILYIPDEIAQIALSGGEIFKIQFISPAARIMRQEEVKAIERYVSFAINTAVTAGDLSILDNIDFDIVMHEYQDLIGASSKIMRAKDAVEQIRANRSAAEQQQMQVQVEQLRAEMEKDLAQARKNNTAAGIPIQLQVA